MPLFIAKNYAGKVRDIIIAKNYDIAVAYWQGKELFPHKIDSYTGAELDTFPGGVFSLLRTKKMRLSPFGGNAEDFIIVED